MKTTAATDSVLSLADVRNATDSKLFALLAEAKTYATSRRDDAPAFARAVRLVQDEITRREI